MKIYKFIKKCQAFITLLLYKNTTLIFIYKANLSKMYFFVSATTNISEYLVCQPNTDGCKYSLPSRQDLISNM